MSLIEFFECYYDSFFMMSAWNFEKKLMGIKKWVEIDKWADTEKHAVTKK